MSSEALALATSRLASALRRGRGRHANGAVRRQPPIPLELYEFEGCPFGRLVREALTELDLDALIHPCPEGGTRFRPKAQELGGKLQFPFLVDPNTGRCQHESAEIVDYLSATYGGKVRNTRGWRRRLAVAASYLATVARGMRGIKARASRAPALPLELYGFENDPRSRLVRELLCELELPHWLRNSADPRGRNRERLIQGSGRGEVPCLMDPNIPGCVLFGAGDSLDHLHKTYALS